MTSSGIDALAPPEPTDAVVAVNRGSARSAVLIVNPRAGDSAFAKSLHGVVTAAAELGWRLDVAETSGPGDATRLAAEAVEGGRSIILAGGGDGTLNEVIQAVAGTDSAVGAVPLGTVNVWVRELGLSLDPAETIRQLLHGQIRRIDLGLLNGRYFLLMAGLGFDAVAVHAIEGTGKKRRFGPLAFFAAGALEAIRTRGQRLRFQADGRVFEMNAALVTIGNTRLWAGAVEITRRATAVDGLLDVCVFPGRSLMTKLRHLLLVFIGRHEDDPEVTYLQVRELRVAARPDMPIQLDGEPFGTTPARVKVVPGAIRMLVGPDNAPSLGGSHRDDLPPVGDAHSS